MYKVLAKLLANRLKVIIPKVISESQFSYLEGRQMLDCILIANEVVDDAKRRGKELLLFKSDFENAFDSGDNLTKRGILVDSQFMFLWLQ